MRLHHFCWRQKMSALIFQPCGEQKRTVRASEYFSVFGCISGLHTLLVLEDSRTHLVMMVGGGWSRSSRRPPSPYQPLEGELPVCRTFDLCTAHVRGKQCEECGINSEYQQSSESMNQSQGGHSSACFPCLCLTHPWTHTSLLWFLSKSDLSLAFFRAKV